MRGDPKFWRENGFLEAINPLCPPTPFRTYCIASGQLDQCCDHLYEWQHGQSQRCCLERQLPPCISAKRALHRLRFPGQSSPLRVSWLNQREHSGGRSQAVCVLLSSFFQFTFWGLSLLNGFSRQSLEESVFFFFFLFHVDSS